MPDASSLLETREGRAQTNVLAAIAEAQYREDEHPRQRDLVDEVPLSKGAVSNTCTKLVETGLVTEADHEYRIEESVLLGLYREHVDGYLPRESKRDGFAEPVATANDVRTAFKRELRDRFEEDAVVREVLVTALISARGDARRQTLREVFLYADQLARTTARHVVTSDDFTGPDDPAWYELETLLLIAVAVSRSHADLADLASAVPALAPHLPGQPPEYDIATTLHENIHE